MTFDKNDLVERLRHTFEDEAADRIEELEAQLAVAGKALNRLLRPPNGHPHIEAATKEEWAVRAMNAENKLAVEYIRADIADQRIAELETTIESCRAVLKAEKLCDYCDEADPLRQAMCLAKECGVKDV